MTSEFRLQDITDAHVSAISAMVDDDIAARRWKGAHEALDVLMVCEPLHPPHMRRMALVLRHRGREIEAQAYEEIVRCAKSA